MLDMARSGQLDAELVSAQGVPRVHELYCRLLFRFHDAWVAAKPANVMAFPTVFADFCKAQRVGR